MKLLVGLGNPGPEYACTRHNVGFEAIDRLARRYADPSAGAARSKFSGLVLEANVGGERALLLKPLTYMNRSGQAVSEAVRFHKLDPAQDVLVIADDLDLPCGQVRLRGEGGAGGHNGLSDIAEKLGGTTWTRLRIGIDRIARIPQVDYVLGKPTPEQQPLVDAGIEQAVACAEMWCRDGLAATMSRFNSKVRTSDPAGDGAARAKDATGPAQR
jgi:PTH1 family peptidyl-tRNA hydrolase